MSVKVIVVDDSSNVRRQVVVALEEQGYEVLEAKDGLDGLEKIRATSDLSLVICDVNMPNMNGIDMIEAIRQSPPRPLQIIMLTTIGQSAMVRRAAEAGAKAWIVKPFKKDHLIAAIQKLLGSP
jgi:two-component system chemotaxis response regulator CheY